jgi:hypothetical protein
MNVLVILEDTPRDQFIAVPVVQALFQFIGRPAKVAALPERMRSVEQATDLERLLPVLAARRGMVDVFLLIVDRDCKAPDRPRGGDRAAALQNLERQVIGSGELGASCHFLACQAVEELEIWLLAGFEHASWMEVRDHCDPKEAYFEPFAKGRGVFEKPAEGRAELMSQAIRRYKRIRHLCDELQALEARLSNTVF